MTSYYIFPDQIYTGFGVAQRAGNEAKAEGTQHVFVIADPGVVLTGLVEQVIASLKSAGLAHTVYDKVVPNPDCDSVDTAADAYRASGADAIIGIGGGSGLDTAKAVRLVVAGPADGKVGDYAYRMGDKARLHPKHLPFYIAIPTTAGTGAEVTPWAVITDPKDKFKFGVGGVRSVPSMALIDPELMMSLPPFLTAATGMDALTHCIEAYVSTNDNPALDAMILHGIGLVGKHLPVAVAKGSNLKAREAMATAAMIGGIAISSKWLGACHSLAHQLSGFANVQHGLANAIMLPHVMRFNLPGALEKYARIADALDGSMHGSTRGSVRERAERSFTLIEQLNADVGLPTRLRDVGVTEDMIPPMAKFAYTVDLNWWTNPRNVNEEVMAQLYREAM
jgi:alcohol dehydrogenase class IV